MVYMYARLSTFHSPLAIGLSLPSFPQYTVRVKYATEHRCGVVVHGGGLTDAITGTDPLKDNLPLLVQFVLSCVVCDVCRL